MIDIKKIDPSPYQHRKYFDEERLKELGASILQDGLIEPIVVMPQKNNRYQLIAGERRLKAVKKHTHMTVAKSPLSNSEQRERRGHEKQ
jgi:ParB family chromosome partitioning protein